MSLSNSVQGIILNISYCLWFYGNSKNCLLFHMSIFGNFKNISRQVQFLLRDIFQEQNHSATKICMHIEGEFLFSPSAKGTFFWRKEGDVLSITDIHSNIFVRPEGKILHFGWKKITFFA